MYWTAAYERLSIFFIAQKKKQPALKKLAANLGTISPEIKARVL
jgi:hypothetical protein